MGDKIQLYDYTSPANIRFIGIAKKRRRFDLGIVITDQFFGKLLILDMQGSRFAIIGPDDLEEENYLEETFHFSKEEADELRDVLQEMF